MSTEEVVSTSEIMSSGGSGEELLEEEKSNKTLEEHADGDGVSSSSSAKEEPTSGHKSPEKSNESDAKDAGVFAQPFLPPPALNISRTSPSGSSSGVSSMSSSPSSTSSSTPSSSSSSPHSTKEEKRSSSQRHEKRERTAEEKQEKYQQILSTLNYHPPKYGAQCADVRYNFEVLKNGTIVDSVKFSSFDRKGYYIIGRVPGCDIVAENPTVSRMHAVLQFIQCPKEETRSGEDCTDSPQETGLYLYDLKSTHGTFLNKNQLYPQKFYRVHVGHVLKFGSSQRMYIVNGPEGDEEEESEKSVTELMNERLQKDLEKKRLEEEEQMKREKVAGISKLPRENIEEEGIDWGMQEDADEETDMRVNPFAIDYEASDLTLDNPKKTLRSWFERDGSQDLEFEMREKGVGQYICRIALPLDGMGDGPVYAESEVKVKKKEAVNDAAMKACQILDSHGLLRASNQESRKRKEKKWVDEDYYSSDEDTYLDRTGSIEKKRQKRMKILGKSGEGGTEGGVLTYDSLCSQHAELEKEIEELKEKVAGAEKMKQRADDGDVDIDDYMNLLKSGVFDVKKLKARLKTAQEEIVKTKKLMDIAKPAELPSYLQMKPTPAPVPAKTDAPPPEHDEPQSTEASIPIPDSRPKSPPKLEDMEASDVSDPPNPSTASSSSPPKPKPMVGPRKPASQASSTVPTELKRFGLITPKEFQALKASKLRPPSDVITSSTSNKSSSDEEDDDKDDEAAFQEEEDDDSSEGEDNEVEDKAVNKTGRECVAMETGEDAPSSSSAPEFEKPAKKKRQRFRNQQKYKNKSGGSSGAKQTFEDDPNYSEWVPPTGQTGDGRTSLNEKLGY